MGDGANMAARLEAIADRGAILATSQIVQSIAECERALVVVKIWLARTVYRQRPSKCSVEARKPKGMSTRRFGLALAMHCPLLDAIAGSPRCALEPMRKRPSGSVALQKMSPRFPFAHRGFAAALANLGRHQEQALFVRRGRAIGRCGRVECFQSRAPV